jgi:hypothetical protein
MPTTSGHLELSLFVPPGRLQPSAVDALAPGDERDAAERERDAGQLEAA